ncbi:ATP-binding protein [Labrenzia sp. PHM005]|uniref:ATP-binding protein n=1 Tax=Labrenzia sp. PHM005 TaxID=2590016 RepID=UPI00143D31B7|nr:ATP-binding protein [Labrenzia sp. PHM005]
MARFWPRSMVFQVLLLLCVVGVIMILAGAAGGYFLKQSFDRSPSAMTALLNSLAISKLNEVPAELRAEFLEDLREQAPNLKISVITDSEVPDLRPPRSDGRKGPFQLGETLFGIGLINVAGRGEQPPGVPPTLYFRLSDGDVVQVVWDAPKPPPLPGPEPRIMLPLIFVGVTFIGLMLWAARSVVRPLGNLAAAAAGFGHKDTKPVPLDEHGPEEVRAAARAFNRMQERIDEFVKRRTETLAAISHDLRTPLTRLRLRLDLLDDGEIKDRSLADLELMDKQISQALMYLRGGSSSGPKARIDLPSLLQSIVDQYADTGLSVDLKAEPGLGINANVDDLTRALCNLIDNANHYASGAEIVLEPSGRFARIDITDHGPGIPETERARLLDPFERGDQARQIRDGQGFGLGLAISKTIVEGSEGTLDLLETMNGGLTVRLQFPLAD